MDFQRLFKRKEESPTPPISDSTRETLSGRDVLVCEGDLLDGKSPASLVWSNVGGAISVKAGKILGILEGRTRIKTAVLQELYPALFEKAPNPGAEFNIPLQTVVMQLKDVFTGISSEESPLEEFDTPFGQLALEDEVRFKDHPSAQATAAPTLFTVPQLESKRVSDEQDQNADMEKLSGMVSAEQVEVKEGKSSGRESTGPDNLRSHQEKLTLHESSTLPAAFHPENGETGKSYGSDRTRQGTGNQTEPRIEGIFATFESHSAGSSGHSLLSGARKIQNNDLRREGHECLQELYLTDEPLDGSTVADLILQLPRVAGVVIILSDGAALGGGLHGGLSEELLSQTPDFVKHLLGFTKGMPGGPTKFVTFSGHASQISLTIGGDVLILAGHEGRNLPPGLRERLLATAQALNKIYGSPS